VFKENALAVFVMLASEGVLMLEAEAVLATGDESDRCACARTCGVAIEIALGLRRIPLRAPSSTPKPIALAADENDAFKLFSDCDRFKYDVDDDNQLADVDERAKLELERASWR